MRPMTCNAFPLASRSTTAAFVEGAARTCASTLAVAKTRIGTGVDVLLGIGVGDLGGKVGVAILVGVVSSGMGLGISSTTGSLIS